MGLDTVELLMDVEKHFGIEISNDEAEAIETVGDFRDCVCKKLKELNRPQEPAKVFDVISAILVENYAVPKERIKIESHIVSDLGLD